MSDRKIKIVLVVAQERHFREFCWKYGLNPNDRTTIINILPGSPIMLRGRHPVSYTLEMLEGWADRLSEHRVQMWMHEIQFFRDAEAQAVHTEPGWRREFEPQHDVLVREEDGRRFYRTGPKGAFVYLSGSLPIDFGPPPVRPKKAARSKK